MTSYNLENTKIQICWCFMFWESWQMTELSTQILQCWGVREVREWNMWNQNWIWKLRNWVMHVCLTISKRLQYWELREIEHFDIWCIQLSRHNTKKKIYFLFVIWFDGPFKLLIPPSTIECVILILIFEIPWKYVRCNHCWFLRHREVENLKKGHYIGSLPTKKQRSRVSLVYHVQI